SGGESCVELEGPQRWCIRGDFYTGKASTCPIFPMKQKIGTQRKKLTMATTRMKQSGFGRRRNKISKLLDANEAKDLKQPKVTEFFSTIHRTSSSGVKRLKLQLPNEVDSSKSIDYDVLDSRTSLSIGNVTEKPEEADIAVVHNEGAFDSSGWTTFSTAEHLEDGSERSICSEKREAEPTTPQSVTVAVLPSVSPRIRKTTGAHDASALRCRASRSLFTNSKVGIRDEGATIESRGEMYNSKNIALKASELADIVKHNSEIRNAIKGTIKNSNELYDRLKTMVTPRGNEGHKSIITAEKHAELKSKYTAANSRSSEQPSTSTGAPEFILPLPKPKTPSKQQTPSKSCTSSKSLNQTVVAENNLRSPLKCGRAALLLPEVKNCSSLPLPIKYERLYKLFGHMERVVAILHSQDRRITFDEVSRNVQKNVKCDFTIHHFAQLLSVYPKAFNVRLEEHWAPIGGVRAHETRFDYVIEPNLHDGILSFSIRFYAGFCKCLSKFDDRCAGHAEACRL
ncbi:DNA replication factor Cdt1, partial [Toxocara canis]